MRPSVEAPHAAGHETAHARSRRRRMRRLNFTTEKTPLSRG